MKTTVKGRHVHVTPELQTLVERKLQKLDRMLHDNIVSVQVILAQEHRDCRAEIVLHARGDHMLHGNAEGPGWAQAVGAAVDKVDQQAHTLKGKWEARHRRSASSPAGS